MSYKDRSSYDDIFRSSENNRGDDKNRLDKKTKRVITTVVLLAIILSVGVLLIWFLNFATPVETKTPSSVAVEQKEVVQEQEESVVEQQPKVVIETPQPAKTSVRVEPTDSRWYVEHIVGEGESLESLSDLYLVSKETILSVNAIKNISSIKEGTLLKIPNRDGQLYTVQQGDSLSIITNRFNPLLGWKTLQEINALSSEVIYPGQKIFIPSAQVDDDGSFASFDRFIRPAEGRLTALYGQTVVYGEEDEIVVMQGIWIEGANDEPVLASAKGVVVDAGNDLERYGRFVVLAHEDGYKTTYAHLKELNVKIGDSVKKADQIGLMGNSGTIGKRALYFSIEQEGIALNPANFF